MRRNHWHDTTRAQDESLSACLLNRLFRFFLDFSLIPVNQRILPHASANRAAEKLLSLSQRWIGLLIVPVCDLEVVR